MFSHRRCCTLCWDSSHSTALERNSGPEAKRKWPALTHKHPLSKAVMDRQRAMQKLMNANQAGIVLSPYINCCFTQTLNINEGNGRRLKSAAGLLEARFVLSRLTDYCEGRGGNRQHYIINSCQYHKQHLCNTELEEGSSDGTELTICLRGIICACRKWIRGQLSDVVDC